MEKIEYPKWLYKSGESKLVKSEAEAKALGSGWADSPAKVVAKKVEVKKEEPKREEKKVILKKKAKSKR